MDVEELAARLDTIADELAEVALDRLRSATGGVRRGEEPDPAVLAEEKRITRARRSVEKAASVLRHASPANRGDAADDAG
jgi:hypothetical protein